MCSPCDQPQLLGALGSCNAILDRRRLSAIKVDLALIEEQRKPERDADEAGGSDWHPAAAQPEATAFEPDEEYQRERREEDVEPEEAAYAIGEQVGHEPSGSDTMRGKPRPEGGVGKGEAEDAQAEIEVSRAHCLPPTRYGRRLTPQFRDMHSI